MDPDIWRDIRNGDANAMKMLYQQSFQELYAYGFRIIADKDLVKDCLHEVFCDIWLKRKTITEVVYIKSYLKICVRNRLFKEIAESKNLEAWDEEQTKEMEGDQSYEFLLIQSQEGEERRIKIATALEQLTKMQRTIVKMKFYDGLSYEQIAKTLKLKPRTVYNHIFIALSTLRTALR